MRKYFGTDGIRGYANKFPMTADFVLKVGMAAASHFSGKNSYTHRVVIGKDTRLSGYMLEQALTAGLSAMGKDVLLLGPIPTPGVAMLTKAVRADFGIMISASHNPYGDNGIKIFDSNGNKLVEEEEKDIERLIDEDLNSHLAKSNLIGRVSRLKESAGRYIEYVKRAFPEHCSLHGLKIALDCSNGAAYRIAPIVFYELGAEVITIGTEPNGMNINQDCGSTNIEALRAKVLDCSADIGIAFDGDADRVIMVDEKGNIIDGDKILAVIATRIKKLNKLRNNTIVGTVMANGALPEYLATKGIEFIRVQVGDKYVAEELRKSDLIIGGEQSGHVIITNFSTTGDGLVAALQVLTSIVEEQKPASVICNLYENYPQVLKNLTFVKDNPLDNPLAVDYMEDLKAKYPEIRFLIRKSGTENLVRVMLEGKCIDKINDIANQIITFMKKL